MINELLHVIREEARLIEDFLKLLDRQRDKQVANDLSGLNEVTQQQQLKLLESQRLGRRREQLIVAIKEAHGVDGDITVARLLELADKDQSARLLDLRDAILNLNDSIARARNTNTMLLNRSREYINRTMAMLARLSSPETTHDHSGGAAGDRVTLAVDRRI